MPMTSTKKRRLSSGLGLSNSTWARWARSKERSVDCKGAVASHEWMELDHSRSTSLATGPSAPSSGARAVPWHEHGALERHEHGAVGLEPARAHGDEAFARPALGETLGEHLAVGIDRVADEHRRLQLHLAPAHVGDGLLADVGDAHAGDDGEREAAVDQRLLELGAGGIGGIEMQGMLVHCEQREPDVVGLRDGAAGAVLVDVTDDELVVGAAGLLAEAAGRDLLGSGHAIS